MYSKVYSGALLGVNAAMVQVEVDAANGLPTLSMVGSLGSEVRESKERVWAALKNMGMEIPPKHITVNLSPADLHKEGTAYDLPIAVGMLQALDFLPERATEGILFLGELGLSGELRKVRGVLPIVREAARQGIKECIVPRENETEGGLIPGICVRGADHIRQVLAFLMARKEDREEILPQKQVDAFAMLGRAREQGELDFSDIKGQETAKRGATIAAAGFHNLLMLGPPGAGKSMIAKRLPGIMPPLSLEESLEVTAIYSVAGKLGEEALISRRPFQSPHHTISQSALTGGGVIPRPGMISLAHRGVLFLDELAEFQKSIIDSMRQPLEDRQVQITRVGGNIIYPADYIMICAMNPCPCGYYPDRNKCRCTQPQIQHYTGKVSGPILDRVDLCVELKAVNIESLHEISPGESTYQIRQKVERARRLQEERFQGTVYRFNGDVQAADMDRFCGLGTQEKQYMEKIYSQMGLSARSYHRIRKVARTIADLEGAETIKREHLLEAVMYRPPQEYWK